MPGLVVVAGGKYTTYRVMAKDAVDEVARALDLRVAESGTDEMPLVGAEGYKRRGGTRGRGRRSAPDSTSRASSTVNRYGSRAEEVIELVEADPALGRPLPGAEDYLCAASAGVCTKPKSISVAWPAGETRMLAGFTSV